MSRLRKRVERLEAARWADRDITRMTCEELNAGLMELLLGIPFDRALELLQGGTAAESCLREEFCIAYGKDDPAARRAVDAACARLEKSALLSEDTWVELSLQAWHAEKSATRPAVSAANA